MCALVANPDAIYWLTHMLEAGKDLVHIARRITVCVRKCFVALERSCCCDMGSWDMGSIAMRRQWRRACVMACELILQQPVITMTLLYCIG